MTNKTNLVNNLRICFWNVEGVYQFLKMEGKDLEHILSNHIIGLYETWCETNYSLAIFNRYSKLDSFACKNKQKGRAKGGISLLYRNDIFQIDQTVILHENFIIARMKHNNNFLLIAVAYIQPEKDKDYIIELLGVELQDAMAKFPDDLVIAGGDFNSRISDMGQDDSNNINPNCNVRQDRASLDCKHNRRGLDLLDLTDNNFLTILNGRITGDIPGQFTFRAGQGCSVIDLIMVNDAMLSKCLSLNVIEMPYSHHYPCMLETLNFLVADSEIITEMLTWNPGKEQEYGEAIINLLSEPSVSAHIFTYEEFVEIIVKAAKVTGMHKCQISSHFTNKVWFDLDCKKARAETKRIFKIAKQNGWNENISLEYVNAKNTYKSLCREKKEEHTLKLQKAINNSRNSQSFWQAVKRFRLPVKSPNKVAFEKWLDFYSNIMPAREENDCIYLGNEVDELDEEFSLGELEVALAKLKNKKSPGVDNIPNEFLKHLPTRGKVKLLETFNQIFFCERTPLLWSKSVTVMIYKKDDALDPANYRPIALLNTMYKLFTQILQSRIVKWADKNGILPEAQGGFRRKRGCDDQIFCLYTAVQKRLNKKRGKLYALFIDFARAFPSISHKKLWDKLHTLGMSGKIIRILKYLYEHSSTVIRSEHGVSESIEMTLGLAQGCVLSPILFSLFIADIENLLLNSNLPGVTISVNFQLQILLFADDMVLLATDEISLQKKINVLYDYFEKLDLKVNLGKTKVMVFRKGGRLKQDIEFYYGSELIEIVNDYVYLGVIFSQKGVFQKAANNFKQKGIVALGSVWKTLFLGKVNNWESKVRLFESISMSCTLYGSHIWSFRYMDKLNELQTHFYKRLLGVERTVPNYLIRLEVGAKPMMWRVLKQTFNYWFKIMNMEPSRYVQKCFLALKSDWLSGNSNITYNWVKQFNNALTDLGGERFCIEEDLRAAHIMAGNILANCIELGRKSDIENLCLSKRFSCNKDIWNSTLEYAKYLSFDFPYKKISLLAQVRLNYQHFYFEKFNHLLGGNVLCKFCNYKEEETLLHIIFNCQLYGGSRLKFDDLGLSDNTWIDFLKLDSIEKCDELFNFMQNSLRYRKIIIEDDPVKSLSL